MENKGEKRIYIQSGKAIHPVAEKIEDFLEHFYNGDLTLKPEAFKIPFEYVGYYKGNLGTALTMSLANYLTAKGNRDGAQIAEACDMAIFTITQVRSTRLMDESSSLLSKLKVAEQENKQLKEEKAQLENKLLQCQKDNEEWHKWMDNFGDRSTVTET